MKIAVWTTPHEIANTVAISLARGFNAPIYSTCSDDCPSVMDADVHIGYGILRGMDGVFRAAQAAGKLWFNVDKGYLNPGHFDGTYRLSCGGTQARYDPAFVSPECELTLEPIREYDPKKRILVCPPTKHVRDFFGYSGMDFETGYCNERYIVRLKGDTTPIDWNAISAVITFNSSVGWEAVRRGIPCLSDPQHSVVGSYYNTNSLDELIGKFNSTPREPLFRFLKAHQFTLAEIEQGHACHLIESYGSAMIAGKQSPQRYALTPSPAGPARRFQSNF